MPLCLRAILRIKPSGFSFPTLNFFRARTNRVRSRQDGREWDKDGYTEPEGAGWVHFSASSR